MLCAVRPPQRGPERNLRGNKIKRKRKQTTKKFYYTKCTKLCNAFSDLSSNLNSFLGSIKFFNYFGPRKTLQMKNPFELLMFTTVKR